MANKQLRKMIISEIFGFKFDFEFHIRNIAF
ncbi:hypothetical protein T06_13608 [Trichinella sp. T6]|nr:hypothetical protein T06_13608 [Trichinella sp. T6]